MHSQGLVCLELTGDTYQVDYAEVAKADIIMTTPEKWDSTTRSWRDNQAFAHSVTLVLIDEVHLLNDKPRGATLEAVVARMKVREETNRKKEGRKERKKEGRRKEER